MADPSSYTREEVGGITIYTIYGNDEATIVAMLDDIFQHYHNHPVDSVLLALIDASRIIMKPYIVRRVIQFGNRITERIGYVAFLVPKGYDGYVFRAVLRQIEIDPKVRRRAFFQTREEALAWLETCPPKDASAPD